MFTIPQPTLPTAEQVIDRLRSTDYRQLALTIWSAFVTACVFTYIAGQYARRGFNYLIPHILTALRAIDSFLESSLPEQPEPTAPPKLQHPAQQSPPKRSHFKGFAV